MDALEQQIQLLEHRISVLQEKRLKDEQRFKDFKEQRLEDEARFKDEQRFKDEPRLEDEQRFKDVEGRLQQMSEDCKSGPISDEWSSDSIQRLNQKIKNLTLTDDSVVM